MQKIVTMHSVCGVKRAFSVAGIFLAVACLAASYTVAIAAEPPVASQEVGYAVPVSRISGTATPAPTPAKPVAAKPTTPAQLAPVTAQPVAPNMDGRTFSPVTSPKGSVLAQEAWNKAQVRVSVPETVSPGTAVYVEISGNASLRKLELLWGKKKVVLMLEDVPAENRRIGRALLPVALDEKAKKVALTVMVTIDALQTSQLCSIPVEKRVYPSETLTVEPKFIAPDPSMKERIATERASSRAALATVSPQRHWAVPFLRPVPGAVSSVFGMQRVFNGKLQSTHRGTDLRGETGTPIHASADGVVLLSVDYYYSGNAVYLDHGQGVITTYLHMSKRNVEQGAFVRRGDVIGFVGSTGRSTGPHLHFGLNILGQGVDAFSVLGPDPVPAVPAAANSTAVLQSGKGVDTVHSAPSAIGLPQEVKPMGSLIIQPAQ